MLEQCVGYDDNGLCTTRICLEKLLKNPQNYKLNNYRAAIKVIERYKHLDEVSQDNK